MKRVRGFSLIELLVMTAIVMSASVAVIMAFRPVEADSEALRFVQDVIEIREGVRSLVGDSPTYENVTAQAIHRIGRMPDGLYEPTGMLLHIPHTRSNSNFIIPVGYHGVINGAVVIGMMRPDLAGGYVPFCERYVAHLFHEVSALVMGGVTLKQSPGEPLPSSGTIRAACSAPGAHMIVLT